MMMMIRGLYLENVNRDPANLIRSAKPSSRRLLYVYYCRTYEAVHERGGREGKRRTCAKGRYQPRPMRSSLATSN